MISHSFPVPVSRSLQVSLLASQPTESAAKGEPCRELAISHDSHHVSLVQWTNLFASRHKGHRFKSPGGYLCGTGIPLLALSRYTRQYNYFTYKSFPVSSVFYLHPSSLLSAPGNPSAPTAAAAAAVLPARDAAMSAAAAAAAVVLLSAARARPVPEAIKPSATALQTSAVAFSY